jgi:hypothetical protein
MPCWFSGSGDSSVGIATGYGLDGLGSIAESVRFVSSPQRSDLLWGPPSLYPINIGGSFPGVKAAGVLKLTDRSPPCNAKVKKGGAMPPLAHLYGAVLNWLNTDNFTVYMLVVLTLPIVSYPNARSRESGSAFVLY